MKIIFTEGFNEDRDRYNLGSSDGSWAKTPWQKIKRLYWKLVPYHWRPCQIWYQTKCFFWHRHTTVKPKTLPYHTWVDRDELMVHCMFECLCQFIELEKPREHFDLEQSQNKSDWEQLFAIYDWWVMIYAPAHKRGDNIDYLEHTLTDNLHKLVELRGLMWT